MPTPPPISRATGRGERRRRGAEGVAEISAPIPRWRRIPAASSTRSSRSICPTLAPLVNGPDTPDLAHGSATWARGPAANGVPSAISAALVGSCTNSSYEDIARAASIARQARRHGLRARTTLLVTPGSEQVRATIERDGLLATSSHRRHGAGQRLRALHRPMGPQGTGAEAPNTIVTSYNRNFPKRNDGSAGTKAFVTSPEMVVAYALAGTLDFDPRSDPITTDAGRTVRLRRPGRRGPPTARLTRVAGFVAPQAPTAAPSGRRVAHLRTPAAAGARSRPGTAGTTSTCPCW